MKTLIFTILITLAITDFSYSQVTQEWFHRYNAGVDEFPVQVATDNSGNVYVAGNSGPGFGGPGDYLLLKYNSSGTLQWFRTYNGTANGNDNCVGIGLDNSGNIYLSGFASEVTSGNDCVTLKYNTNGDELWVRKYNSSGTTDDYGRGIFVTPAGNVYVTGSAGLNFLTLMYNSDGDLQWNATYNNSSIYGCRASEITVDQTGNVYVTGSSLHDQYFGDILTIKYNSSGIQQWAEFYISAGSNFDAIPSSIKVSPAGNVYVAGTYEHTVQNDNSDFLTLKYNSSGVQQWFQRYHSGGTRYEIAFDMEIDNLENVYVTGVIGGMTTLKYNSSGILEWTQIDALGKLAYDLVLDASNNVYVTGRSYGPGTIGNFITEKYNSSGQSQWVKVYDDQNAFSEESQSIALDSSGNVYVTGQGYGTGTIDCITLKYSQLTGISQNLNSIPDKFSLSQNYPNPFNPVTVIRYSLTENRFTTLKVYDVLGNEVATLINEQQNAGTYSVDWDAANFPSGVYFYRLHSGEFIETKRMSLIK